MLECRTWRELISAGLHSRCDDYTSINRNYDEMGHLDTRGSCDCSYNNDLQNCVTNPEVLLRAVQVLVAALLLLLWTADCGRQNP